MSIHASGHDHGDQHRNRHPEAADQRKRRADRTPQLGNFREQDWPYSESTIRPGGPARSHASWTSDQEAKLREQWLAADSNTVPGVVHDLLAEQHGRSAGAIRSRLIKLQCDIDAPGQSCTPERAAELKARIEAEYAAARA
ncbi:hypothetical protein [Amycolatopsis benzoatilytica]|uniref:hypothetical protein n=1 Tax=Amycolatopsis benzoatilytica TaxID=346045 RepID=UPI0012B6A63C|nr:hypothetical protein [Amycolatopsis benzoatilytica]